MMNEEQFEALRADEWGRFCRRYPHVTHKSILARLLLLFRYGSSTPRLLWENGFLRGWILATEEWKKQNHE